MTKIIDRLLKIIELKEKNKTGFYNKTGLSNGFLDKVTNIGSDKIEKILSAYPDINAFWLITGKGEMLAEASNASPKQIHHLPKISKDISIHNKSLPIKLKAIPVLDQRAAAGWPSSIDDTKFYEDQPKFTVPELWFRSGEYLMIQVEGDSMHPTIYNGDWLFIRRIDDPQAIRDGDVYVVVNPDGVVCKRVLNRFDQGYLALQSDNEQYNTYTTKWTEVIQIWRVERRMTSILKNENADVIGRIHKIESEIAGLTMTLRSTSK
jgi:repressor LexA